jgi:general nucleoside transport system permease protein
MSGSLKSGVLPNIRLPVVDQIPVVGTLLSGHHVLTYLALLAVPVVSVLVGRTPFGLHLRAVGVIRNRPRPQASRSLGCRCWR